MEYACFALACIAMGCIFGLQAKIKRLERKVSVLEGNSSDIIAIRNKIKDLIDKEINLTFYEDSVVFYAKRMIVKDVDDEFVLIAAVYKKETKNVLIRIEDINSIEIKK